MMSSLLWLFLLLNSWLEPGEAQGFGTNLIKVAEPDQGQIVCTVSLLMKYFRSGESLSGSVLHVTTTSAPSQLQMLLLEALHANKEYPWTIVVKGAKAPGGASYNDFILHEKPQCYFMVIENMEDEDIDETFENWKSNVNWNPLAQFVVYLSTIEESEEEMTDIMIEVLLSFMNKKIYNVNVIGQHEEESYFYGKTVFPYHPDNNCGNRVISIETLDICDYQEEEKEEHDEETDYDDEEESEENVEEDGKVSEETEGQGNSEESVTEQSSAEAQDAGTTLKKQGNSDVSETDDTSAPTTEENDDTTGNKDEEEPLEEQENSDVSQTSANTNDTTGNTDLEETMEEQEISHVSETSATTSRENEDTIRNKDEEETLNEQENSDESQVDDATAPARNMDQEEPLDEQENSDESQVDDATAPARNKDQEKPLNEQENSDESQVDDATAPARNKDQEEPWNEKDNSDESDINDTTPLVSRENSDATTEPAEFTISNSSLKTLPPTYTTNLASEEADIEFLNESTSSANETISLPFTNSDEYPKIYIEEMYRALFLDKFPKDLSGCPLVAAYRPWEPYIFKDTLVNTDQSSNIPSNQNNNMDSSTYDYDDGLFDYKSYEDQLNSDGDVPTDTVQIRLNGIEYQMIQTIAERLHISIDLQVENTNVYHLFQQLIDGDIEMVIGGIDEDPSISQYVSSTVPYHQDDLTWCVAKAQRSHNLFNFVATFEARAWILTIIFILTASLSILMSQKFLNIRQTVLTSYFAINIYVMGIILSQALQLPRIPTSLKLCFGTTFFMGLIFSNVYQSFLISTLTTPKSSYQISHTQEIYENRMNVMGSVDNVRHLSKKGETFRYVREHFQMCYNIEECLQHAATDAKLAVAVSRLHSFYNPRIPRDNLYCFDRNENIYVYLVTMLLPKKFHLLHKINPVIQHIIESGHMQKWARDLDMRRKIIEEIQRAPEEPFKSLTIAQVAGPFALSGLLLALALGIFLLELLVHWMVVRRRTRLKIAKYLHRKLV